jgi:hypothetical protein
MWIDELPKLLNERRKEIILILALFVVAIGLFSLDWFNGLHGGVSTVGAERVLAGEIPYRDFWTIYAPGHFYLLALLFRICGTHYLVEVVSASVICASTACACYFLALNSGGKRLASLACAAIFLATTYNTGYFKNLGTYPLVMLFIFIGLICISLYYRTGRRNFLFRAGLATGAAVIIKHDVAGYTAIATVAGLLVNHFHQRSEAVTQEGRSSLLSKLGVYFGGIAIIAIPLLLCFALLAGPEMAQDLVIFPLTDFRFARPEKYPSLLPLGVYAARLSMMLVNLSDYLKFAIPFMLFLLGIVALVTALRRRRPDYVAMGVTFSFAYLFHYMAAHVQINTHIISMSVYGALLGLLFWGIAERASSSWAGSMRRLSAMALVGVWLLALTAVPAYSKWASRRAPTVELSLQKVSGIKVSPEEARDLTDMSAFVEANIPPGQSIFIGLHRHDVVIIGDVMLYFILNRPSATRYQELHPAITDTAPVQREIIDDLQDKKIPLIVLKHIFPDQTLESVKENMLKNLPQIGATELDTYIREKYVEARRFGDFTVWQRKENITGAATPNRQ